MKAEIIDALSMMPDADAVVLVDKQKIPDIIRGMRQKHSECRAYYDKICELFDREYLEDIGLCLWTFLRDEMIYREESEKMQRLPTPKKMMKRGNCDCKGYSLFSGGVLDAMNRRGAGIDWCYRYVPADQIGKDIGHVFVVIDPGGDEIWVDPVLSIFDRHIFYARQKDEYIGKPATIGRLSVSDEGKIGLTAPEQSLLDQLNDYTLGIQQAVQVSTGNATLNTISAGIVATASVIVPGVGAIEGILQGASQELDNAFGPGSFAARLLTDISSNILTAPYTVVKTLLNPGARTFESDQYEAAWYYYYYVKGISKYYNSPAQVADSQVPEALKWFIDRLGVFISGREHIIALTQGAQQYISYRSVNAYTTSDLNAVGKAVAVAQMYFNFNAPAGGWANTIGVYDEQLGAIAQQLGQSLEQVNAEVQSGQISVPFNLKSWLQTPWPYVVIVSVIGIYLIMSDE